MISADTAPSPLVTADGVTEQAIAGIEPLLPDRLSGPGPVANGGQSGRPCILPSACGVGRGSRRPSGGLRLSCQIVVRPEVARHSFWRGLTRLRDLTTGWQLTHALPAVTHCT